MSRDGLPRAYLRLDPNIDQVFPVLRNTFVGLMCSAGRQPERGRYRDRRTVEGLHSKTFVKAAFERGDLTMIDEKRVYLDGWDEWQEGDWTVAERMRRMRDRRKRHPTVTRATPPPSPDRNDVTTDAGSTNESLRTPGDSDGDSPPPQAGRRKDGTNPRAVGTNPRANGTSPRQKREAEKRGPTSLGEILRRAAAEGHPS